MLSPTEKPSESEIRTARIVDMTIGTLNRVIRYRIPGDPPPKDPGHCFRMDRVFEVHIPHDGGPATWWMVFSK